jgi:acetyltransferase-like isoleucine patch superfamily enzyme
MSQTLYQAQVQNRSVVRFYLGMLARLNKHLYYSYARYIAKKKGATIGENVVLPLSLAKKANANLVIGNNSSLQSDLIDLRAKVTIGNNVIIGSGVEIITCSHEIDSPDWEFKAYGIEIEDYTWIATRVFILPSCRLIARGAVCGAGALVIKNVEAMSVVSGSPAVPVKFRKQIHSNLVVESLLGGDFRTYIKTWKNRDRNTM